MKRSLAVIALALVGVLALPVSANAYGTVGGPSSAAIGASADYTFQNIPVTTPSIQITVDGPGDATLAGIVTITKPQVGGAATVNVTFPTAGKYTVSGTDGGGYFASISVNIAAAPADSGLPNTGSDPAPILWFGGGLLLLGGLAVGVFTAVRRSGKVRA
jgi:hypothetical protein